LRRLADRGTAVLVASHDPNLIAAADSRTDLA
jgi:ABC-type ATPase involved in cell division